MQAKTIKILIYSYAEIALINKRNGRMHRGDIEKGIIYSKYKEWTWNFLFYTKFYTFYTFLYLIHKVFSIIFKVFLVTNISTKTKKIWCNVPFLKEKY